MNPWLGGFICVFKWHKIPKLELEVGQEKHIECSRCNMPLKCWIEQDEKYTTLICEEET